MSYQDRDCLVLEGLSILNDPRPNSLQPVIAPGINLRWAFGRACTFPLHGYHLFRRAQIETGERCLSNAFAAMKPGPIAGGTLDTDYGRISGVGLRLTDDFAPAGRPEIDLAGGLHIDLPAPARQVTLQIGIRPWVPEPIEIDFRAYTEGTGPNPRVEAGIRFEVGTTGALLSESRIRRDWQGLGLQCNPRLTILLPNQMQPTSFLITRLQSASSLRIAGWSADGKQTINESFVPATTWIDFRSDQFIDKVTIEDAGEMTLLHRISLKGPRPIRIIAMRGSAVVGTATVTGAAGSIVTTELKADSGITSIVIGAAGAALVDLCQQALLADGKPVPGPWNAITGFPYPLTLPVRHPSYPAAMGAEELSVRRAAAMQRVRYGTAAEQFPSAPAVAAAGTITLTPGSALVKGEGTAWDDSLVGQILHPGSADTAFVVATVLAPARAVLSRPFTGAQPLMKVPYRIALFDFFAQLHDQVAALLSDPDGMRSAAIPPVIERAGARRALLTDDTDVVKGEGTSWTKDFEGLLFEGGSPTATYRILSVDPVLQQLQLHARYSGRTDKYPYRILSLSPSNRVDHLPSVTLPPLDVLELAAFTPSYAQVLGLAWTDNTAEAGRTYDYILIADHANRFHRNGAEALAWLRGTPDFTGSDADGALLAGIKHAGSGALAAPASLRAYALPSGRMRMTPDRPDLASADAAVSISDLATWAARPRDQSPLFLEVWRAGHGTAAPAGEATLASFRLIDRFLPALRKSGTPPPAGWPDPALIHYIDTNSGGGHDVGWYSYRVVAVDAYGRFSVLSNSIPWYPPAGEKPLHLYAVHLEDLLPPPPPVDLVATVLEPEAVDDPLRVVDAAYKTWRAQAGAGAVGLRVRWRWPWSHVLRAPDLAEFRIYAQAKPLNARFHRIVSVSPAPGNATRSIVKMAAADSLVDDAYAGAMLQVDERGYAVEGSRGGASLELQVRNGGAAQNEPPSSGKEATLILPRKHPLHTDMLDPLQWERFIGAASQAASQLDIDPMEDPDLIRGESAVWNGSTIRLDDFPATESPANIRAGVDVLSLDSAESGASAIVGITSVAAGNVITPSTLPNVKPGTYRWTIGAAGRAFRGLRASWTAPLLTLDVPAAKVERLRPGFDKIYLRIDANSTPANAQHYFEVESVDAATKRVALKGALSLLQNGKTYEWRAGTPVRQYEAFFTDAGLHQWLSPTIAQPVVYATLSVSAADKRTEVPDARPLRTPARPGNEGLLAAPATLFRVHRTPPPIPADGAWDVDRLVATRADYHGTSDISVRWPAIDAASAPYTKALIFRTSRETLFQADWTKLRTFPLIWTGTNDPRPSHWTDVRKANVEKELALASSPYAALRKLTDFTKALDAYRNLSDDALSVLANLGNDEAFAQITIEPIDLTPGANPDRRGPDDPETYKPRPTLHAILDSLPGRVQTRYLYKVAFIDLAQNLGPMSKASPPVYIPKVVPPRTPVITKISSGDRHIVLQWAANRDSAVAGYRIYRTRSEEKTRDLRLMALAKEIKGATLPSDWVDRDIVGQQTHYYRLTAFDTAGNESAPSTVASARAFDESIPVAPAVTVQAGAVPSSVRCTWMATTESRLERRPAGTRLWQSLTTWKSSGSHQVDSTPPEPSPQEYRLKVRSAVGFESAGPIVVFP